MALSDPAELDREIEAHESLAPTQPRTPEPPTCSGATCL